MLGRGTWMRLPRMIAIAAVISGTGNYSKPVFAAPTAKTSSITIKSFHNPGLPHLRDVSTTLAAAGVQVRIDPIKGHWFSARPTWTNKDIRKSLLNGSMVTTGTRRLTAKEKASGLKEAVIGYLAAVIAVHPDAPINGINTAKWKQVIKSSRPFTWRDIAADAQLIADQSTEAGPNPIDQVVSWSFPDKSHASFARPFVGLGALSRSLIKAFPQKGRDHTPAISSHVIADNKDHIGVFGYDLIQEHKIHPLKPVRILKVDGVYPSATTIANGSYTFSTPVTIVYAGRFESIPRHAVARLLKAIKEESSVVATKGQPFLFRRF